MGIGDNGSSGGGGGGGGGGEAAWEEEGERESELIDTVPVGESSAFCQAVRARGRYVEFHFGLPQFTCVIYLGLHHPGWALVTTEGSVPL